jgi:histidine triad (HIT) family protein
MSECIFCKLAKGEIPTTYVYEDASVVAFDDLNPQAPVHVLIVPREHYVSVGDTVPEALLGHLLAVATIVAERKGIAQGGYRIIINTGTDAGQTVLHLHVHVLGGVHMEEGMLPS